MGISQQCGNAYDWRKHLCEKCSTAIAKEQVWMLLVYDGAYLFQGFHWM